MAFHKLLRTGLWGMDIHPTAEIAPTALIDRTWPRGVHIGARCRIGDEVVVLTHDMTRGVYLDTNIGAGTQLGPRAIILPGLTIGEDCIVMPGALVTKDMPARSIAMGSPATIQAIKA
jgi:acetyltransferase-like isoleucine patch superfamily enzyme